jgi:DNA-3-methyladenine glycosylase II
MAGRNSYTLENEKLWRRGVAYLRRNDRRLAKVLDAADYKKIELDADYYGALIESIIFQQLAGNAARAILGRFKNIYGGRIPKPPEFLHTDEKVVRGAGISPQKYSYIKDLCEMMERGVLELEALEKMGDDEVIKSLSRVRGIGRWTAEMFLIFCLGRPDVMPADDLGIRKAIQKVYRLRTIPDRKRVELLSKKWHPYCSVATLCLWANQDAKAGKDGNDYFGD